MPRTPMNEIESERLLQQCELIRVSFREGDVAYLIPLGCIWADGALYGATEAGRKTELASLDSRVTFQTDTALETGLFEWESVMGHGAFEIVADAGEKAAAVARLLGFVARAPGWWKVEQGPKLASGQLLIWRIRPDSITGVRCGAPA